MSKHLALPLPITTLTINPALDVSTSTASVMPEHKMRCGPSRLDPGGGGVNVSRVIARLGRVSYVRDGCCGILNGWCDRRFSRMRIGLGSGR